MTKASLLRFDSIGWLWGSDDNNNHTYTLMMMVDESFAD